MFRSRTNPLKPPFSPSASGGERRRAAGRRAWVYGALILAAFSMMVALWWRPVFDRSEHLDWRPALALAAEAWERGDLYGAAHLYSQAARTASRGSDWEGLVAAACGFARLDGRAGRYSRSNTLLIHAAIFAEQKRSRRGIATIAAAFTRMGQHNAASLFLARIGALWPVEKEGQLESSLEGCGPGGPR